MAAEKTIVLITGGKFCSIKTIAAIASNKQFAGSSGIGFELASQLLSDPSKHVLLGSRSLEKGEAAVKGLMSEESLGSLELLQLDVASEESIAAAAKSVETNHGK